MLVAGTAADPGLMVPAYDDVLHLGVWSRAVKSDRAWKAQRKSAGFAGRRSYSRRTPSAHRLLQSAIVRL